MLCKKTKVIIVDTYEVKDNKPTYKKLDKKINETLKSNPDKSFIDVKLIDRKTALIILER